MFSMSGVRICRGILILSSGLTHLSAQEVTPQDLWNRVEARCERYSTLDLRWKVVSSFTERYLERLGSDPFGGLAAEEPPDTPPGALVWMGHLQCDGSKFRLSHNQPRRSYPERHFVKYRQVVFSDGTEERFVTFYEAHTQGMIMQGRGLAGMGYDRNFVPLITQFRASQFRDQSFWSHPDFSYDVTVTEEGKYLVMHWKQRSRNDPPPQWAVWFDTTADYSIVRATNTRGTLPRDDVRIELAQRDGLWIPERWVWLHHDDRDGELLATHAAELMEAEINQPIDPSVFNFKFPRLTIVSDQREDSPRYLLIGSDQREYEVTTQQRLKAESLEALLAELEGKESPTIEQDP